ncbi:hypothetical protein KSX_79640 [Ktedonospora formicarum]|uniref:Uncharacterized protein n=1 Tax=Ktedonospora formicarum TaxID=2778364 RepID=A0A8J3I9A7_9CHLR|nr:hypothetical protein KSX_79640 [Ktedonospora formicarum]
MPEHALPLADLMCIAQCEERKRVVLLTRLGKLSSYQAEWDRPSVCYRDTFGGKPIGKSATS